MCQFCPQIETSQLICCANQLAGFYMSAATLALNGLSKYSGFTLYQKKSKMFFNLVVPLQFLRLRIEIYWFMLA